jgi:hypothetical protein
LEEKLLKFTGEVFKVMDTDNNGCLNFEVQRNIFILAKVVWNTTNLNVITQEFKVWVEKNPSQTEWIANLGKVGSMVDVTQRKIQEVKTSITDFLLVSSG